MTTGTYNVLSAILNVASVRLLVPAIAGSASRSASLVALLVNTQSQSQKCVIIIQLYV